jgi:hypothetical protein
MGDSRFRESAISGTGDLIRVRVADGRVVKKPVGLDFPPQSPPLRNVHGRRDA